MSVTHSAFTPSPSSLHSAVSLPREHLVAIQHIINDALALQARASRPPPPPYNNVQRPESQCFKPRMDLYGSRSASGTRPLMTATFELPGMRKEDVHIDVLDNHMVVAGDRRHFPMSPDIVQEVPRDEEMNEDRTPKGEEDGGVASTPETGAAYAIREIKRGRFRRVVPLPVGTKLEDVKASMHDGILTVTFPGSARPVPHSVPVV